MPCKLGRIGTMIGTKSRTEFGRTEREKDGKHRSPKVTDGQQRSLENRD